MFTNLLTTWFGVRSLEKAILTGEIASAVGLMLDEICQSNKWTIIAKEIQPDHIHLFLTIPPALSVAHAIKILKGSTARKLFAFFPELRKKLWGGHLWSPSYYSDTAGNVSAQTNRTYQRETLIDSHNRN